ncbi:MAG TPA: DUF4434 domain-containing protein [Bacteroidales bacterium]|nr:DUF4434 domain-containing protein [Bacteroidales bacterium]HBH84549.1 DUF4434 domain-containing protein [Bacteroidales bacterium]HBQ84808.1 DUF4434 domain-containing protein [Bacteroidales bacterium]
MNLLGLAFFDTALPDSLLKSIAGNGKIKPIEGSWFEFQHHSVVEGKYWDHVLKNFTAEQWDRKVKEIADTGIRYLVLLHVAIDGKTFYPSRLLPKHQLGCDDPLETVLTAADKCDIRFFISNDFFGEWTNVELMMKDKAVNSLRVKAMNEVAEKYSHHKSFYGWYFPNETSINGHFRDFFIDYVNSCSSEAKRLTPNAETLIAPYGTRLVSPDDQFVKQLEQLDVSFIAYQDEVGVNKTSVDESAGFFEKLNRVHSKAGRSKLWADVEVFSFEGTAYKSALIPAQPERIIRQLEAVSPYVEKIFIYQYIGLINKPDTDIFAGHPDSALAYNKLFGKL